VLLRVRCSALCGSDFKGYRAERPSDRIAGHETVGEVVAVNGLTDVATGERVVAQIFSGCGRCFHCASGDPENCADYRAHVGGHAEYFALPSGCCRPLPDDVSWEDGLLLGGDTIGVPNQALARLGVNARDTAVVFGCGPLGLGAVAVLRFFGARTVAVEPIEYRRRLACEIGAEVSIDPAAGDLLARIRDLTNGRGADLAVDCSPVAETVGLALDSVAKKGRVALVGEKEEAVVRPSAQIIHKELTIVGSLSCSRPDYFRILDLRRRGLDVSRIITHRFPFQEIDRAYDLFASGQSGKVVLYQHG
jgi:propanol-preferring alcohol dehydrogenase